MQAHDSDIYFDDIKMQMVPEGVARGRVGLARIGEKELARFWVDGGNITSWTGQG